MVEEAAVIGAVEARPRARRRRFVGSLGLDRSAGVAWWAFLSSRVLVWVSGWVALGVFGANRFESVIFDPDGVSRPFHSAALNFILGPAARWDSVWYIQIARGGYFHFPWTNFFPLYPLMIHAGKAVGVQPLLVGLVISIASMLIGLTVLHRLALLDVSGRAARLSVLLVAFFPMAFYLTADYTESLFLALTVGAVYAARLDAWAWAGALGALASATRSNGVLIVVPLVLLYLYGPRRSEPSLAPGRWWRPRYRPTLSALWLLLAPAGLGAYMGYLAIAHGAPLAPFQAAHLVWGHNWAGPFGAVVRVIEALPGDLRHLYAGRGVPFHPGDPLTWQSHDLIDFAFLLVAVVALIASWRRVPFAYSAYTIALLAFALSFPPPNEPLQSLPRYVLAMFPLFIGSASWLEDRRLWTRWTLGVSGALLVACSGLWATWAWLA